VETPTKRIGRVAGIRYGERSNEPAVLEVRAGFLGRRLLLISVDEIAEIAPKQAESSCRAQPNSRFAQGRGERPCGVPAPGARGRFQV
jgi:hypothetical protein